MHKKETLLTSLILLVLLFLKKGDCDNTKVQWIENLKRSKAFNCKNPQARALELIEIMDEKDIPAFGVSCFFKRLF